MNYGMLQRKQEPGLSSLLHYFLTKLVICHFNLEYISRIRHFKLRRKTFIYCYMWCFAVCVFCVYALISAGQALLSLRLWPGLILALLTVS